MKLVHLDPLVLMECVTYFAELVLSCTHCCAQPPVLRTDYSPRVPDRTIALSGSSRQSVVQWEVKYPWSEKICFPVLKAPLTLLIKQDRTSRVQIHETNKNVSWTHSVFHHCKNQDTHCTPGKVLNYKRELSNVLNTSEKNVVYELLKTH